MDLEQYKIIHQPHYNPIANETELFTAAYEQRLPLALKGPTGCGKTRFVEHMAWRLGLPLITINCHEDMTAADLVGRYMLRGDHVEWQDGPLTQAVRYGAICYLDEIVEARQDTTVVIHGLTDERRALSIEKKNERVNAHESFFLVISYNPGYQSAAKDLKESTKQRFACLDFGFADPQREAAIVSREAGIDSAIANTLVRIATASRNLRGRGLDEGASTRTLIRAGKLIAEGVDVEQACEIAVVNPLTDELEVRGALRAAVMACL